MEINNVIEIVVALDVAIFSIAYPLLVTKVPSLAERYNSLVMHDIIYQDLGFKMKNPKWLFNNKLIKLHIYSIAVLLSFVPLIFQFNPLITFVNHFFNVLLQNSAYILVIIVSIFLIAEFLRLINIVYIYSGSPSRLFIYLRSKYDKASKQKKNENENEILVLKTINDICIYYVNNVDYRWHEDLEDFYYNYFKKERSFFMDDQPVEYNRQMYEFVIKIAESVIFNDKIQMNPLLHRAISGLWWLGEEFEAKTISERTYSYMWRLVYYIADSNLLITTFWKNSHSHLEYRFKKIQLEYNESGISNLDAYEESQKQIEKFKEFHYALGGNLVYLKQYQSIRYIINHTESQPERYPLLPLDMAELFRVFVKFRDYRNDFTYETKYYFKGLDNIGNSYEASSYIAQYMVILFLKQFKRHKYLSYEDHTGMPDLKNEIDEYVSVKKHLPDFEFFLNDILEDKELLSAIGNSELIKNREDEIRLYPLKLKEFLRSKIIELKKWKSVSKEIVTSFKSETKAIISKNLEDYSKTHLFFEKDEKMIDFKEYDEITRLRGIETEVPKSAFSNLVTYEEYKHIGERIMDEKIENHILRVLIRFYTYKYLIESNQLVLALKKLGVTHDFFLLGIGLKNNIVEVLEKANFSVTSIENSHHIFRDGILIIPIKDLPLLRFNDIPEDEKGVYGAEALIDKKRNIYCTVLTKEYSSEIFNVENVEDVEIPLKLIIAFNASLYFKNNHQITLIELVSEFRNQGIPNTVEEILPLKTDKD